MAVSEITVATAAWGVANSTSQVLMVVLFYRANFEIPHMLSLAGGADLEVNVAVQLCHVFRVDPTLAMQSVTVLAHDILQLLPILELNESHVRQ